MIRGAGIDTRSRTIRTRDKHSMISFKSTTETWRSTGLASAIAARPSAYMYLAESLRAHAMLRPARIPDRSPG
jgi:hypothetical protein